MSEQWRILVVEDEENLNQSIVNSLRKDGYFVQGVMSGAEAIRMLWTEEFNVVIGDLKTPGADGFELLQWLRTFRPRTRMIMVAAAGPASTRTHALEAGVVSYLEKPLDLHLLKEELRRLLQQTGFSANLDSFDLLDVIQIITMSRKSIALVVNTGLEERGVLRFQRGELIWAEYGLLRGEEAFFALAAHKNGTVVHQPWDEQIAPNVTQPLSRLIMQALQYRTKYAALQQPSGELQTIADAYRTQEQKDDSPILVLTEEIQDSASAIERGQAQQEQAVSAGSETTKEWWQQSGKQPGLYDGNSSGNFRTIPSDIPKTPAGDSQSLAHSTTIPPARKISASEHTNLPSWLTEQPTQSHVASLHPPALSNSPPMPATSPQQSSPAEWQSAKPGGQIPQRGLTGAQKPISTTGKLQQTSSPEWLPPAQQSSPSSKSEPVQNLALSRKPGDDLSLSEREAGSSPQASGPTGLQRVAKRNYPALVAALQTLGYSITGFIAAAVVSLDGQPIAQVAVDELDISRICGYFSHILQGTQGALQLLAQGSWSGYEHTVITSADRHILISLVGSERSAFQVLITTREADPAESLEVMVNVEGAIGAALR